MPRRDGTLRWFETPPPDQGGKQTPARQLSGMEEALEDMEATVAQNVLEATMIAEQSATQLEMIQNNLEAAEGDIERGGKQEEALMKCRAILGVAGLIPREGELQRG